MELYLTAGLPGAHPPMWNVGWDKPIQWLSDLGDPPISCEAANSKDFSQCNFVKDVSALVPAEATHVQIRLKAVAQLTTAPPNGQKEHCLVVAHAYNPLTGELGNHIIHTEFGGDGSDGQTGIGRDVEYVNTWLPIFVVEGVRTICLRVQKRILVSGYVSITATLEGYWI